MTDRSEGPKPTTSAQLPTERPYLAVGPKPIEINRKYYDPFHSPKLYQTTNGKQEYRGGIELDKDTAYSMRFWSQPRPKGLREAMQQNIESAIRIGTFSNFAVVIEGVNGRKQLDEVTKEKLSAYRKLAEEMGYLIGPFILHEKAGTVTAEIKTQPKQQS